MLGKSLVGMRVRDGMRLVDYLATRRRPTQPARRDGHLRRRDADLLPHLLDTRIRPAVVSGYYSSFRDSILAMHHCTCNFVPGILHIGEMSDLVGLIVPRPMLVEAGTRDPIFPIQVVRASVARREVCAVLGGDPAKDVELDEFEGRHSISGRQHMTSCGNVSPM